MECIFCKIINDDIPSKKVYEDNDLTVIMDIAPSSDGHILIIPKKHYTTFVDLDNDILIKINEVAKKMNEHLTKTLNPDGLTLVVNYGSKQEVKHYHMHLVPAYKEKKQTDTEIVYNKIKDVL